MPHIQIQFRRDTSISWTNANPVLASGEMGIELDTKQFKIGDGTTRWSLLPYGGIQGPVGPAGLILPSTTPQIGQVLTYVGGPPSGIQWRNQLSYNTTTAVIRGSKAATNFDFTSVTLPTIPAQFGSGFTSGTDTDTFSIIMNTSYNLQNLPIITGTAAYWDNSASKMFYMQMKFGNSSTSNSIAMTIEPTTTPYNLSTNYGTPLKLTLSGISANAFTGVGNIGSSPLNYAIVVYLQLNN